MHGFFSFNFSLYFIRPAPPPLPPPQPHKFSNGPSVILNQYEQVIHYAAKKVLQVLWFQFLQSSHWIASCRGLTICRQVIQLSPMIIVKYLQTCQPAKGRKIMWDSEPKAGKSSEKWVLKSREMSQISFWKDFQGRLGVLEVAYHFKAEAVNITIILYELGFVICMFYLRPSWEREQLHIWWQWQVARKDSRMQSNATAKCFLWIELAIYWYLTWKRTL